MKKLFVLLGILAILGAGAYYILLKKPEVVLNDTVITTAIDKFNEANPDFKLIVEKGNIEITPVAGAGFIPKYQISIKNPEFQYTLAALLKMASIPEDEDIPEIQIVEKAESLDVIFEPTSSYLAFRSIDGLTFTTEIPDEKVNNVAINGKITSIKTTDINLTSMIKNKGKDIQTIYSGIIADNPTYEISINDFTMSMLPNKPKPSDEITKVEMSLEKIEINSDSSEELIKAIYDNTTKTDFASFAKKGAKHNTSSLMMKNLDLNINGKGNEKGGVNIGSISLETLLKPSTILDNTFFLSFGYKFNECNYVHFDPKDVEGKKAEKFAGFNAINLNVSADKISPQVLELYVNLMRQVQSEMDENPQIAQQLMMTYMDDFKKAFLANDPIITFSLDPMDHKLGKANINGQFEFSKEAMFPLGKATSEIKNVPEIKQTLLTTGLMKPKEIENSFMMIDMYFKNDGTGNYKAEFEVKNEAPFFFLNGEPMK